MRIVTGAFALLLFTSLPCAAQILDVRELNTVQIQALDRASTAVLLPGGILEEHGPYLPSYSAGYQTEFVVRKVAEAIVARPGWTVVRFPALPLGTMPASEFGGKFAFPVSYPVRMSTSRAVYMDLATDLGEAGFKWIFVVNLHGAPPHTKAIDDASRYFNGIYGGRMTHLSGLNVVAGAVPQDIFTLEQRAAEGVSVHADADEHSRVLFLRQDLVPAAQRVAPPVITRNMGEIVLTARGQGWTAYFGTPAIATAAAGSRVMNAIADAAVTIALQILDGGTDAALPRVADGMTAPGFKPLVDQSLAHDLAVERKQTEWLVKQKQ
ncbi:MAG: creatininase family protein [Acidobacteria bacterium]|nr:creatininase family protein [Acidobacteriota bacterium]